MKFYFSHRNAADYVVGLIVGVVFQILVNQVDFGFRWPNESGKVALTSAIMSLAASLLGLVLAASTFLVSHVQNDRFAILREARSWSEFPRLVKSCLWRLFILAIFSGICSLASDILFETLAPLLLFIVVVSGMSVAALIWVTSAIISIQTLK